MEDTYTEFELRFIGKPVTVGVYTQGAEPDEPDQLLFSLNGVLDYYGENRQFDTAFWKFAGNNASDEVSNMSKRVVLYTVRLDS